MDARPELGVRGKRVTVVGLARSGHAACALLARLGARVLGSDARPAEALEDLEALRRLGVRVEAGGHSPESFLRADLLVVSPGVDGRLPLLTKARALQVPVWGEVELAYRATAARFIGITGTKGKGTTATLLGEILSRAGRDAVVAGNIGRALCDVVPALSPGTWVVAELSSFQLEGIHQFRAEVALLLNLAPDHLDRYPDPESYYAAKARLFANQRPGDVAVLNADDPRVLRWAAEGPARRRHFSRRSRVDEGAFVREGAILLAGPRGEEEVCRTGDLRVPGAGMLEDALAACASAGALDIGVEPMADALLAFRGREHCLELVGEVAGVRYYNDSKATNVFAVGRALESFGSGPGRLILIAGGRDKREDFRPLAPILRPRAKALILIGEAREKLRTQLEEACPTEEAEDLPSAVRLAAGRAAPGDTVLLSPGCASFDMFQDAEERGRAFREAVAAMGGAPSGIRQGRTAGGSPLAP